MEKVTKNTWICEKERTLLASPFMEVVERRCRSSEDDRQFNFYLLKSRNWCNIIPVTEDGKIVLVRQYRIGISEHTLEIPGGVADATDQDNQFTAIREMQEETGYVPLPGAECIDLGWNYPNPAIMNNRCHSYVIGPVKKMESQKLDPGEMIETVEVPISEIPDRIANGEINHALILNAFFFLAMRSQTTSNALIQELSRFTRPHTAG